MKRLNPVKYLNRQELDKDLLYLKKAEYSFLVYSCKKTLFGNYVFLDAQNWYGVRLSKKKCIFVRLVELSTVSMATQRTIKRP